MPGCSMIGAVAGFDPRVRIAPVADGMRMLPVAVRSMQDYEAFGIRELVPEKGVRGFKSMIVIREVVGFDPARVALER